jgi:hypothetical protein
MIPLPLALTSSRSTGGWSELSATTIALLPPPPQDYWNCTPRRGMATESIHATQVNAGGSVGQGGQLCSRHRRELRLCHARPVCRMSALLCPIGHIPLGVSHVLMCGKGASGGLQDVLLRARRTASTICITLASSPCIPYSLIFWKLNSSPKQLY